MRNLRTFIASIPAVAILSLLISSCTPESAGPTDASGLVTERGQLRRSVDLTQRNSQVGKSRYSVLDITDTLVLDNESNKLLGLVTLSNTSQSQFLTVGQSEVDSVILSFIPTSVTINSQVCAYPDTIVVSLLSGAKISVGWQNPNLIAIWNYVYQN